MADKRKPLRLDTPDGCIEALDYVSDQVASGEITPSAALGKVKTIEGSAKLNFGNRLTLRKIQLEASRKYNLPSGVDTREMLDLEAGNKRFEERLEQVRRGVKKLKQGGQSSPRKKPSS
jgi:hypothetical protein